MATKTTIEMAREAAGDDWGLFQEFMPEIHRLVELVRADERARMAEQPAQQEPVAAECKFDREEKWVRCEIAHHNLVQSEPKKWPGYQTRLLYTSPPAQRTWVGLTDGEWMNIVNKDHAWYGQRPDEVAHEVAKLVEAKLKEKNT